MISPQGIASVPQLLNITANGSNFAIPLDKVCKVIPILELSETGDDCNYILGAANIFGEAILVIDLCSRLGLARKNTYDLDAVILICELNDIKYGLLVDKLKGVHSVSENDWRTCLESNEEDKSQPFFGIINLATTSTLLLKLEEIFPVNVKMSSTQTKIKESILAIIKESA